MILNAGEGNTIEKVHVFYIGNTVVKNINNWNQLVAAGKLNPQVFGSVGYKTYQAQQLDSIRLPESGNYVLRVQYADVNGNQQLASYAVAVDAFAKPTTSIQNDYVILNVGEGYILERMYVFYVGNATIENINNWNQLVAAGRQYPEINCSWNANSGYFFDSRGMLISGGWVYNRFIPPINGRYIIRVQYTDGVESKLTSVEVNVTHIIQPEITVENGKISIDDKGFTLSTLTVFYIGEKDVADLNTWQYASWDKAAAASKNVAGSPYGSDGYKCFTDISAISNIKLTTEGNYILRLRYGNYGSHDLNGLHVAVTI